MVMVLVALVLVALVLVALVLVALVLGYGSLNALVAAQYRTVLKGVCPSTLVLVVQLERTSRNIKQLSSCK
jgi:hypothetical protein